jgi:hypothetical protein
MRWRFRAPVANDQTGGHCRTCRQFLNDPRQFEALTPGLVSFGSGNASVRADDGLCQHHARYVAASAGCTSFEES